MEKTPNRITFDAAILTAIEAVKVLVALTSDHATDPTEGIPLHLGVYGGGDGPSTASYLNGVLATLTGKYGIPSALSEADGRVARRKAAASK